MTKPPTSRLLRLLLPLCAALLVAVWSGRADAYAWMIKHDYAACQMCHADPSGGGLLTPYGRGLGETILRMQYGRDPDADPGKTGNFLFGLFDLPEQLLLGGDFRRLIGSTQQDGLASQAYPETRKIDPSTGLPSGSNLGFFMQADLQGQLTIADRFRVNGSIGYADYGGVRAALNQVKDGYGNWVSRVHWIGYDIGEDKQFTVRAGRMNLPFGLRMIEHTMWVRTDTRTDINDGQQHGASISYNAEGMRGELMLIAGNYQLHPDDFRDRGYAGYFEYAPTVHSAVGVSSMVVHPKLDVVLQTPAWRHAHGVFGRYSPMSKLAFMAEADLLLTSQPPDVGHNATGYAGLLQADYEPIIGLHFIASAEAHQPDPSAAPSEYGGWGTVAWFFAPHADVRLDGIRQMKYYQPDQKLVGHTTILGQLHFYL